MFLRAFQHNYADYLKEDWPLLQSRLVPAGETLVTAFEVASFSHEHGILGAFQLLRPHGALLSSLQLVVCYVSLGWFTRIETYSFVGLQSMTPPHRQQSLKHHPLRQQWQQHRQQTQPHPQQRQPRSPLHRAPWRSSHTPGPERYGESFARNEIDMAALRAC